MNRSARFDNARSAVAAKLLSGGITPEAELRAIAAAELGPRALFLVDRVINAVVGTPDAIGPDIIIRSDDNCETFAFGLVG